MNQNGNVDELDPLISGFGRPNRILKEMEVVPVKFQNFKNFTTPGFHKNANGMLAYVPDMAALGPRYGTSVNLQNPLSSPEFPCDPSKVTVPGFYMTDFEPNGVKYCHGDGRWSNARQLHFVENPHTRMAMKEDTLGMSDSFRVLRQITFLDDAKEATKELTFPFCSSSENIPRGIYLCNSSGAFYARVYDGKVWRQGRAANKRCTLQTMFDEYRDQYYGGPFDVLARAEVTIEHGKSLTADILVSSLFSENVRKEYRL